MTEICKALGFHTHRIHFDREQERFTGRVVRDCSVVAYEPEAKRVVLGFDMEHGQYELYWRQRLSGVDGAFTEDSHILATVDLSDPDCMRRESLRAAIRAAREEPRWCPGRNGPARSATRTILREQASWPG